MSLLCRFCRVRKLFGPVPPGGQVAVKHMYMVVFLLLAPDGSWGFCAAPSRNSARMSGSIQFLVFGLILGSQDCPEFAVHDVVFEQLEFITF